MDNFFVKPPKERLFVDRGQFFHIFNEKIKERGEKITKKYKKRKLIPKNLEKNECLENENLA